MSNDSNWPKDVASAQFYMEDGEWRLHSMDTGDKHLTTYDCAWTPDGYTLHCESGGGGREPYLGSCFVNAKGACWSRNGKWVDTDDPVALGWKVLDDLPAVWLSHTDGIVHCSKCQRAYSDYCGEHCDHVWWCNTMGGFRGPGMYSEPNQPCSGDDCSECESVLEWAEDRGIDLTGRRNRARLVRQRLRARRQRRGW